MIELAAWLASLPLSQALRRLSWLVPWLQIIHILANGLLLAAVVRGGAARQSGPSEARRRARHSHARALDRGDVRGARTLVDPIVNAVMHDARAQPEWGQRRAEDRTCWRSRS